MNVVVEMPFDRYYHFLGRFEPSSHEAEIMTNGVLNDDPEHIASVGKVVITCDLQEARRLLDCALRLYPEAVLDLQNAIDLAHEF
jgi:hypothetical protein